MVVLQAIVSCCKLTTLQLADHTRGQVHASAQPDAIHRTFQGHAQLCDMTVSLRADKSSSMLDIICSLSLCSSF